MLLQIVGLVFGVVYGLLNIYMMLAVANDVYWENRATWNHLVFGVLLAPGAILGLLLGLGMLLWEKLDTPIKPW